MRRIIIYYYHRRLTKIIYNVYHQFWPSDIAGELLHKQLNKSSWYLLFYCSIYTFSAFLCGSQYTTIPYFAHELPFASGFAIFNKSPFYELTYIWQSFIGYELVFCVCGMDVFFVSLISNCIAQFKILKAFLNNNFENAVGDSDDFTNVMRQCVEHHKQLLL